MQIVALVLALSAVDAAMFVLPDMTKLTQINLGRSFSYSFHNQGLPSWPFVMPHLISPLTVKANEKSNIQPVVIASPYGIYPNGLAYGGYPFAPSPSMYSAGLPLFDKPTEIKPIETSGSTNTQPAESNNDNKPVADAVIVEAA